MCKGLHFMSNQPPVRWTQQHIDQLERAFPELLNESDATKLLVSSGSRAVVHYVKAKFNQQAHHV